MPYEKYVVWVHSCSKLYTLPAQKSCRFLYFGQSPVQLARRSDVDYESSNHLLQRTIVELASDTCTQ